MFSWFLVIYKILLEYCIGYKLNKIDYKMINNTQYIIIQRNEIGRFYLYY